ncbi:MAG: hypothetical protein LH606_03605 [Cytophagaceae bacterium]|nr:hypothetical protein [Cytophagaceae bacterium]
MKSSCSLLILLLLVGLAGCSRRAAEVKRSQQSVQSTMLIQESAQRNLDRLAGQSNQAAKQTNISESANASIQAYVASQQDSLRQDQAVLQQAQTNLAAVQSGKAGGATDEALRQATRSVAEASETLRILERKTAVIVDFLGSKTFSKSEIGALFRPGEYRLVPEQAREGRRLFSPIVEKLYTFAEKYRGQFQALRGEIIVTGYSDASPVERGSRLYRDLAKRLGGENVQASDDKLNRKLSELRAGAVKELLEGLIRSRGRNAFLNVSVSVLGRGVEIPPGVSESVAINDHRRRVVTFYWVVLPTL